jgi:hypothetical protein
MVLHLLLAPPVGVGAQVAPDGGEHLQLLIGEVLVEQVPQRGKRRLQVSGCAVTRAYRVQLACANAAATACRSSASGAMSTAWPAAAAAIGQRMSTSPSLWVRTWASSAAV